MQAILITCYKDKENLYRLISQFDNKVNVYVHIDKKSKEITQETLENKFKNIKVIKKYNVVWGGYNHLLAVLDLLKMAVKDNNDYIHIVSGQDILTKQLDEFFSFFNNNNNIYMTLTKNNSLSKEILNRYKKGTIIPNIDCRSKLFKLINKVCTIFKNKNNIGNIKNVCKGMIWCSFPAKIGDYIVDYCNSNKKYLKDLKYCIIPEEFFFQTIIMNSEYKDKIVNDNLRYTDWNYRNGSNPAYLDISDYNKIKKSNSFFARKIDSKISFELIKKIEKDLSKKHKLK